MEAVTNPKMNKAQLLALDIWSTYWDALTSLEYLFKKELELKLKNIPIISRIESMSDFFDKNGKPGGWDYPQLEEIYFQLFNRKTSLRISISFGNFQSARLELVQDEQKYYDYPDDKFDIKFIFSPEVIEAAVDWLDKGSRNKFAKNNFK